LKQLAGDLDRVGIAAPEASEKERGEHDERKAPWNHYLDVLEISGKGTGWSYRSGERPAGIVPAGETHFAFQTQLNTGRR
jgi:hypothetical protein